MSTRASAPRCASCGMPLAPDATACAVCGARVPLIARTSGEEDAQAAPETPSRPVGGLSGRRAAARGGADPVSSDPLSADALRPSAWPTPRAGDDRAAASSAGHPIAGPAADASPSVPGVPTSRVTSSPVAPPPTPAAPGPGAPAAAPSSPRLEAAAVRDLRSAARASGGARPADVPPSVGRRVGAYAIDLALAFVAGLVGVLLGLATGVDGTLLAWALGLVVGVAQIVAEGLRGTTLGARLLGVRTVDERTGAAPGVPRAFVRQLVVALGTPVCLVGNWVVAASAAWDKGPQSRGWHDKASGTRVVRTTATAAAAVRTAPAGAPAQVPGRAVVPPGDALYAPPPRDVRGPVPPPPVGPPAPRPPAPAPDLVEPPQVAPHGPRAERPAADLLPPPPTPGGTDGARDAAARSPREPVVAPTDEDLAELEHTRVRHPESLRRRTGTLALSFDTGERVRVVGRGLVGRGPRAEDGEDILHVVALQDAARSLSRVHAEFGPHEDAGDGAALWVTDRGSTNGTVVVDPAGVARVLPAGTPAVVRAGWTVRLGDREVRVEDD
ncbi:RDD family protein [Cellulomonas iranensis]|uniref:RDD family membrane protein YckC n=3 Tax=Cellulomonas iranensis TaxID=76862 RepID=A0ABU0GML7_9CELL|nr:RDD family protein [Cellulomonas iranensis]MDQ0426174.1 putative RDD family membrane protein YckC [Cellulomonas iranensis]